MGFTPKQNQFNFSNSNSAFDIYELAHNKCFKKKSRKQFNFIHNKFKLLTVLYFFYFKKNIRNRESLKFSKSQDFFQKKMDVILQIEN